MRREGVASTESVSGPLTHKQTQPQVAPHDRQFDLARHLDIDDDGECRAGPELAGGTGIADVGASMRGTIAVWNDDRGFGFIEPEGGGERVFLHISGMRRGAARPVVGTVVGFELTRTTDGKLRAVNVGPTGVDALSAVVGSRRALLALFALSALAVAGILHGVGWLSREILWAYALLSLLAFAMYGRDKWAARRDAQRTPENVLQCCALLGGWPGALLAQQVFRHKSSKASFQRTFWWMVVLNVLGVALLATETGRTLLASIARI